jgi:hypothetical protein
MEKLQKKIKKTKQIIMEIWVTQANPQKVKDEDSTGNLVTCSR